MKKILLTLLAVVVILGVLGGVGFAGYRIGYRQGMRVNTNAVAPHFDRLPPSFNRDNMPQSHPGMNNRNFNRGAAPNHFFMMQRGGRMGFFSLFRWLGILALFGLIIWLGYLLFRGNGWRLSLTRHQAAEPVENIEVDSPKGKSAESNE